MPIPSPFSYAVVGLSTCLIAFIRSTPRPCRLVSLDINVAGATARAAEQPERMVFVKPRADPLAERADFPHEQNPP